MVNPEEHQSANGRRMDDADRADQISDGQDSVTVSSSGGETSARANPASVTRRLSEIFVENGDGDLLLQRSDREDGVLQWLRALDMQVMGACRADERLKPLLKLNVSTGVAEDRLLAHLSQHFEPSEVGMLARCLCIPLVSIRVGKINKQGSLLSPTSIRGNLCLTLLPTSDLRISFNGDDGFVERLATFSTEVQSIDIEIEAISADKSGRSFLIKTSDTVVSYFWCSERSTLLGNELLRKIKDLLMRKPSLAELTGISESRLDCFATHLRAYLAGSMVTSAQACGILSATPPDDSVNFSETHSPQSSFNCQKSSRFRQCGSQGSKTNLIYQGSLSPRFDQVTTSQQIPTFTLLSVTQLFMFHVIDVCSSGFWSVQALYDLVAESKATAKENVLAAVSKGSFRCKSKPDIKIEDAFCRNLEWGISQMLFRKVFWERSEKIPFQDPLSKSFEMTTTTPKLAHLCKKQAAEMEMGNNGEEDKEEN
ncbi:UNVERIFIED_CONTAM: hypothetical protein Sradi_4647900 [Sesamum radiatum]|uniref:PH domain-containing protein n=1 Tax=Sesamum radiatum TaxID=300843 RepID=A0AAW2NCW4_SESRA